MKNENVIKMAEVIRRARQELRSGLILPEETATALHNAGYRKQSDTVKEFAEKLKVKLTNPSGWVLYKCQDLCYDIDKIAAEYGEEVL